MSVGPAALGNVLVQRLDAVLGTTMSAANANLASGARADAVSQPGSLEKPGPSDGSTRDPRQGISSGGARGDRQNTVVDAKTAAALALAARGLVTSSDLTASAPTTLGTTARAILALLAQYPGGRPRRSGARAALNAAGDAGGQAPGAPAQAPSGQQAAQPGQPAPATPQTPAQQAAPLPPAATAAPLRTARPPPASRAARGACEPPRRRQGPEAAAHAALAAGARAPARWARPCAKRCRPVACSMSPT